MLPRHSSGVSETHLTISCSKYRPTSFKVARGLHSIANPRPILTATGARDSESTENLGAPLVQYIALIVDVTVYGNTKVRAIQPVQKTKEVALVRCLIPEIDMPCGHTAKVQESIVFPQDCSALEIYGATVLHESPTGSALNLFSHASWYPQCKLWRELTGRGLLRSSSFASSHFRSNSVARKLTSLVSHEYF